MPLLLLLLRVLLLAAGLAVSRGYPTAGAGEGSLYNSSMCQKSFACGGINIHYPFYLSSESKVVDGVAYSYCGYPGMAVLCDDSRANATATLRLAGGTNYTVHAIDYDNHTITLADADVINGVCPMVRHNVNIPREAWLNFTPTGNSTISFFLDCSFTTNVTVAPLPPPELVPINCTGFERGRGQHSVRLLVALLVLSSAPRAVPQPPPDPGAYFRYTNCTPTPYQCGSLAFDVNYPFAVDGVARPDYCSSPGHRLGCANNTTLEIYMDSGGSFQVTGVDYGNQVLTVIDQSLAHESACPHAYRSTTIDAAEFAYTDRDRFLTAYVNCTSASSSLPPVYDAFACVARGRAYYRLDNGMSAPEDVLGLGVVCSSTLVVPYDSAMADALAAGNATLGDAVRAGFSVRWKAGAGWCGECQASGGRCGHDSRAQDDHTCFCPGGQAIGSCPSSVSGPKRTSKNAIIAVGCSAAALVLFVLLLVVSFLYIRKRRQYKMTSSSRLLKYSNSGGTPRSRGGSDLESSGVHNLQTHHFAYEELEEATGGFSDTRELGDGGFGTVYKGQLRDGRVVAVKRLYNNGCRHVEQFLNEAAILSRLRHPNLVTFYGCTSSRSRELLLVYEYVPNGTVADHLQGHRAAERALPWPLRLNVAVEAAAALAYLHAIDPPVVHRDVKTTNILLDADFHVKVADFGLSRLFPLDGATHVSTAPQGTPGYVDPEYHQCYQLTDRSDVYSFGVVLAELISSKPAVDVTRDRDEINLAAMAVGRIQRSELDQLVDAELGYGSDEATTRAITMVAELAFRCLQQNSEMRPPIKEVLDGLRGIQQGGAKEKKYDVIVVPRSPNTVHAPWDSMSTTPSISQ
ncbi:LEAF RUST 10 DISEASE-RESISTANCEUS RECEPTOR-LIKE PROTEIN KINASE-like 1.4 isoform X2 [Triticum aestivum]|uniref:LEAF RUST 10 DISEASE-RESISTANCEUS RECEPTOR-LIKE PROTEIN KINASE-like 1.4 isoform X2 n=1 Tax=Triticum aestivum TaxID=4565 RepID=UPI001D015BDE|nr:LEAF RUST 10 DISEASE-RESISTANCE LOCUS RECEPTOR-LIKE PROTEIN KINASE-like 1.4 isoform X2 [Triticum aestivum]